MDSLKFPSPYGDMVLKYVSDGVWGVGTPCVSVPLRGYGFEIITLRSYTGWHALVSVPLRGYGFEILAGGCLAVPSSICRFAARMYFPSLSRRRCVLKTAVCPTALSAAGISLSV